VDGYIWDNFRYGNLPYSIIKKTNVDHIYGNKDYVHGASSNIYSISKDEDQRFLDKYNLLEEEYMQKAHESLFQNRYSQHTEDVDYNKVTSLEKAKDPDTYSKEPERNDQFIRRMNRENCPEFSSKRLLRPNGGISQKQFQSYVSNILAPKGMSTYKLT